MKSSYRFPYCLKDYLSPKYYWRKTKHYYQRAKRGWSDEDAWSIDYHIASILAGSLPNYRDRSPVSMYDAMIESSMSKKERDRLEYNRGVRWKRRIDLMTAVFNRYKEDGNLFNDNKEYKDFKRAMKYLGETFTGLWD